MRHTTYGRKGGTGTTTGKKALTYLVTLPDGSTAKKRDFFPPHNPVGYAYEHEGKWYVAAIDEPNCEHLAHYHQCPAIVT